MSVRIDKDKLLSALQKDLEQMFSKPVNRISATIDRLKESYSADEEKVQYELAGYEGYAVIVHEGDGDSSVTTRIYIDGQLSDSCTADMFAVFFVTFTSSLSIRGYTANAGMFYRSTTRISGIGRRV